MKTNILLAVIFLLTAVGPINANPTGKITKEFAFETCQKIELVGNYQVFLSYGPNTTIRISGNKTDMLSFELTESDSQVSLIQEEFSNDPLIIKITINEKLSDLYLDGNINISNANQLNFRQLRLVTAGIVEMNLNLKVEQFEADINGASNINFSGWANQANIHFQAAGYIEARHFEVNNYRVLHEGVGQLYLNAKNILDINHKGLGNVEYLGTPVLK